VVAADRDRVPARELAGAELEDVGDEPHRLARRVDIRPAGDVLLEDVVLGRAADPVAGHPLGLRRGNVQRQQDGCGRVDRHRGADLAERQPIEERGHVVEAVDRDADAAHLPLGLRALGVVAHLGRQVERHRQAGLALLEEVAEAPVGLLGGREPGVLAHRPQPAAIHRRLDAPRERVLPGPPEVAILVQPAVSAGVYRSRISIPDEVSKRSRRSGAEAAAFALRVARQRSRPSSRPSRSAVRCFAHVSTRQDVAHLDRTALADGHARDGSGPRRPELVLHLHGLHDEKLLTRDDLVPGHDRDRQDTPRDDRTDLGRASVGRH
jgi:hypothetical protein